MLFTIALYYTSYCPIDRYAVLLCKKNYMKVWKSSSEQYASVGVFIVINYYNITSCQKMINIAFLILTSHNISMQLILRTQI